MEGLGLSTGAAGLISLGITICQGLLDYYDSWKNAESHVSQMYLSIETLTKTLQLLERATQHEYFDPDIVSRVEESIKCLEKGLRSLKKKLDKVRLIPLQEGLKAKAKTQLRRTLFPFKESTLARLKELGNELRDDLSLALNLLHIDSSITTLHKLDLVDQKLTGISIDVGVMSERSISVTENIRDMQLSAAATSGSVDSLIINQNQSLTRKICNWLSPLSSKFQRKQVDTFNIPNRQDGTAQWFFQALRFKSWLNDTGATLWCPGIRKYTTTIKLS